MSVTQQIRIGGDIIQTLNLSHAEEPTVVYKGYLPPKYDIPEPSNEIYSKPEAALYSHILTGVGPKGRVLLIGDSYSWSLRKFFLQESKEVAWTDRRWEREIDAIRKLHPDFVVMEIVERLL